MTEQPFIQFRPCVPEDADRAVPLMLSSGPAAFAYVFETKNITPNEFLRHAFIRKGGEFSFESHIALCVDDILIGVGGYHTGDEAKTFLYRDLMNIISVYKWKAISVAIRGLKIEQLIMPAKNKEICLCHIGIDPAFQGKGYGLLLMRHLLTKRPINADEYFMLDVSEENPRAIALYEKLNFKSIKYNVSKLKSSFGIVPHHYRMHLDPKQQ